MELDSMLRKCKLFFMKFENMEKNIINCIIKHRNTVHKLSNDFTHDFIETSYVKFVRIEEEKIMWRSRSIHIKKFTIRLRR